MCDLWCVQHRSPDRFRVRSVIGKHFLLDILPCIGPCVHTQCEFCIPGNKSVVSCFRCVAVDEALDNHISLWPCNYSALHIHCSTPMEVVVTYNTRYLLYSRGDPFEQVSSLLDLPLQYERIQLLRRKSRLNTLHRNPHTQQTSPQFQPGQYIVYVVVPF